MLRMILAFMLITAFSCSTDPEPINFGADQCTHCKMNISDTKFGAEIVTKKGKVFKYDAVECMLNTVSMEKVPKGDIAGYWAVDASNPKQLLDAVTAVYLISEKFPSPMGADLSAFSKKNGAEEFQKQYGGELKSWSDLLVKFKVK